MQLSLATVNATSVLIRGPEALCSWRDQNTIDVPGAEFTSAYKRHRWDGTWTPGNWCRLIAPETYEMKCSRGLVLRVYGDLEAGDPQYLESQQWLLDFMTWAVQQPEWAALRDYQQAALVACATAEWGRIAFATNAGKGAVIAMLASYAFARGYPCTVLCDEVAVFDALVGEIQKWGPSVLLHVVKQGVTLPPPPQAITLAMVPTLARRIDPPHIKGRPDSDPDVTAQWKAWMGLQQMLLLDEADKATAPTWKTLLTHAKLSRWRLGFSGTFPDDRSYADWLLETAIGPVLLNLKNKELVDRGISARPTITLASYDATPAVREAPRWEEWKAMPGAVRRQWLFEKAVVFNPFRHRFIRHLIRPEARTVVVVNRVEHGSLLAQELGAVFLNGAASEAERTRVLEQFAEGAFPILIVTKILDRGTNRLGVADDIIFASGEGSDRQTLQRLGRGLRRTDGKAELRLVDVIDRLEERIDKSPASTRWRKLAEYLHAGGRERVELYNSEGFTVEVLR